MNRATFEAMALRRGYSVEDGPKEMKHNGLPAIYISRGGDVVAHISMDVFVDREIGTVIAFFDEMMSSHRKHHHMVCLRCKEPLLRCLNVDVPSSSSTLVTTPRTFGRTMYYEYRSAKAGPDSPILLTCPACGVMLDIGDVGEIGDEAPAWFDPVRFEKEALRRDAGASWRRRELLGDFLEDPLPEGEEPDRTKLIHHWNVPLVEEKPRLSGGSLPSEESLYVPITLPLEDKFLPDRPGDIMLEHTLMQRMFGQPLTPLNAAQIEQEIAWRQRINKALEDGDENG